MALGVVYPCSVPALQAAARIVAQGMAVPTLIGPAVHMRHMAATAGIDLSGCLFADVPTPEDAARQGVRMAHDGR